MTNFTRSLLVLVVLLARPAAALPQDSSIFGQVRAAYGGSLPGVTVEVTSPVLVEQPRIAVTDPHGRYDIGNLRPGAYTPSPFVCPDSARSFIAMSKSAMNRVRDFDARLKTRCARFP